MNPKFELKKTKLRFKILVKALEIELRRIDHWEHVIQQNALTVEVAP